MTARGPAQPDAVGGGRPVLVVNGAFRPQRVSGQQRYAAEVSAELARRPGVRELRPPAWAGGRAASWAWTQSSLPLAAGRRPLLSLTSRAPALCRPHVVTVHDLFPLEHPEWYGRRYLAVKAPLLRHHLRHADLLVTVSEPVAEQIRERTGRADVVVAPNAPSAVFADRAGPDRAGPDGADPDGAGLLGRVLARSGRAELAGRDGFLLSVASLDPRKNLDRLVRAHLRLPERLRRGFPLLVAGGRWDAFAAAELPAGEDVVHVGYVSDADLAGLYRAASAVVVPSLAEGFGLPAVEAAAAGARVALSDIPVFRWVAGADADYFDPLDVASIAGVLEGLLDGSAAAPPAGALCAAVGRRFSWTASAGAIYDAVRGRWAP